MKSVEISAKKREEISKSNTQKLRKQGDVPCVLYGKDETIHFYASAKEFKKVVYTPEVFQVNLMIDGANFPSVIKDIQFHPVTDELVHLDFFKLTEDKPVELDIPVKVIGSAAGVRAGGRLLTKLRNLRVRALPKDLPDQVEIKVDDLEIGQSIRVRDIKIEGVEIIDPPNNVITAVKVTRQVEPEPIAAPAAATTEGAPAAAPAAGTTPPAQAKEK